MRSRVRILVALVTEAERAIENKMMPERIRQGSSGSYFVKDQQGKTIGVFKPKSEEPYSRLNPKCGKWFQRVCCPCCFGRRCLLPNQGYLSEAGASIVSDLLKLDIVPKTRVVWLASETFNYSPITKVKSSAKRSIQAKNAALGRIFKRIGLPPKVGSLQTFVSGYKNADVCLREIPAIRLPRESLKNFQLQFEKLVVLDYIIRNTDRGSDNWLIKIDIPECERRDSVQNEDWNFVLPPVVHVAAIDNGLAFPVKHPDNWRAYPYHWASAAPYCDMPFSQEIVDLVLPQLSDLNFVEKLSSHLEKQFSLDKRFSITKFEKQMSVVRGQIMNLCDALSKRITPCELSEMPWRVVEKHRLPHTSNIAGDARSPDYKESYQKRRPFFTWC